MWPEAFILIKAFALDERAKGKEANDLAFVLRNFKPSVQAPADRLRSLIDISSDQEGYHTFMQPSTPSGGHGTVAHRLSKSKTFARARRTAMKLPNICAARRTRQRRRERENDFG